jgi:hypothetical protein
MHLKSACARVVWHVGPGSEKCAWIM